MSVRQYLSRPGVRWERQLATSHPLGRQPTAAGWLTVGTKCVMLPRPGGTNNNLLSADTREKNWKGGTIKFCNCQSASVVTSLVFYLHSEGTDKAVNLETDRLFVILMKTVFNANENGIVFKFFWWIHRVETSIKQRVRTSHAVTGIF